MDLDTVVSYRRATSRADLALRPGERLVAGGTWLFSEPQPAVTGLVDLTGMGWPALEYLDGGLRIGATCTISDIAGIPQRPGWNAHPLFFSCANALLASFKVWNLATVGGNVCQSLAAAAMVSLCAGLDGVALVWTAAGGAYRIPVADLVTGDGTNSLDQADTLRWIDIPGHALRAQVGFRKIALAPQGRSGAVLTGRRDEDGGTVFSITAATLRPVVLRYGAVPDERTLGADVHAAPGYYTDPLGASDWRRQVSRVLLEEIRREFDG
jgi:CO/xanthine dehydrogenase FAD-binding subunit